MNNRVDPFDLPLGIRFRYPGDTKIWVIIGRERGYLLLAGLTGSRRMQPIVRHERCDGMVELAEELPV